MRQGDAGDSMYLVVTGSCDVYVQGKDKHKDARVERLANMGPGLASGEADLGRLVNVIGPGDPVGEQSLVTGMPRSATIVCRESAELIEILKSDFDSILNSEHDHTQYVTVAAAAAAAAADSAAAAADSAATATATATATN